MSRPSQHRLMNTCEVLGQHYPTHMGLCICGARFDWRWGINEWATHVAAVLDGAA